MRTITTKTFGIIATLALAASLIACEQGNADATEFELSPSALSASDTTHHWNIDLGAGYDDATLSVPVDLSVSTPRLASMRGDTNPGKTNPGKTNATELWSLRNHEKLERYQVQVNNSPIPPSPHLDATLVVVTLRAEETGVRLDQVTQWVQPGVDVNAYLEAAVPADFDGRLVVTIERAAHSVESTLTATGVVEVAAY
ncbi:MAG: hypothetical protein ACI9MR_000933 [Myxococcota bacterium]|jgi:hypothetical protein